MTDISRLVELGSVLKATRGAFFSTEHLESLGAKIEMDGVKYHSKWFEPDETPVADPL